MDESSKQLDYDYADILRQLQSGPNPVAVPMTTNSASELDSSSIFNTQDLGLSSAPSKRHLGITSQVNEIILEANQERSLNREPTLTNQPDLPNMHQSQSQNAFYSRHTLPSNHVPSVSNPNDFISGSNLEHSITSGDDLSSNTS